MSSNLKRATEQLVEGNSKRGKTNQGGTLVLCFELRSCTAASYTFEFFAVGSLLPGDGENRLPDYDDDDYNRLPDYDDDDYNRLPDENMLLDDDMSDLKLMKPKPTLQWGPSDIGLPCRYMSFCHTCSDSSGAVLYAAGGLMPDDAYAVDIGMSEAPFSLPTEFTRIPLLLSGGDDRDMTITKVDSKSAMKSGKFYPLIVEIRGLIYVLSGSPPPIKPSNSPAQEGKKYFYWFEVYDPRKDTWEQLADPPFSDTSDDDLFDYGSLFIIEHGYRSLVVGNKLYVSDGLLSCVYDTESREWKASHLFTQYNKVPSWRPPYLYPSVRGEYEICGLGKGCGIEFPFLGEAILVNEKERIFLCMMQQYNIACDPPLTAFQIRDEDGEEKAVSFPLSLAVLGLSCGYIDNLVDLGHGYFAVLLSEEDEDGARIYRTLVTFHMKLEFDDAVDGGTPRRLLVTSLRVCYRKPARGDCSTPTYCFTIM